MSFEHKAYAFDWQSFSAEMLPWMSEALSANGRERFAQFVDTNLTHCRSPYDGSTLSSDWKELLEVKDVQELADFALTKYYDPTADYGLGEAWLEEEALLPESMRLALLGHPIAHFDPGRQGSYFIEDGFAPMSAELLKKVKSVLVREFAGFVGDAARSGFGVYVTF